MKKILLSAVALSACLLCNAQAKDSTQCQKLSAKLNAVKKIYADSSENLRASMIKKTQEARKQFYTDSLAGKLEKGTSAPILMNTNNKEAFLSLKKREYGAVRQIEAAIKKENCEQAANDSQKTLNNKN
jgi:hypothetical protein